MSRQWPMVPLGEVLKERQEVPLPEAIAAGEIPIVAKIGFENGTIQLREDGQTKTKMILIYPGDLVVSGINAAKGAIAIYGEENTKPTAATIHYSAYVPNKIRVDIKFLWWLLRSRLFRNLLLEYVPGGIKTELKAKRFLPIPVPLPPLSEQRRIMARIEESATKIEEAQTLRRQAIEEVEALCRAILSSDKKSKPTPMSELVRLIQPDVLVQPDATYRFAGVYSFGRGVFRSQTLSGMEFAYSRLTRLRAGNFVYPKLMAWEGAMGIVPLECDGCVVSTEFPVFEVLEEKVFPEVLDTYFRMPSVWPEISGASPGTNVRRRRLNPEDFLNYRIPLPTRETQKLLRKVRTKVDVLKGFQGETSAELDALLPAIIDKAFKGDLISKFRMLMNFNQ